MLPRRALTNDLYACRDRVHIPSIKVTTGAKNHRKSGSEAADSVQGTTPRTPDSQSGSRARRRHTVGDAQGSLRTHLGELGKTLTFSEDVVSSRSPHLVSYRQARCSLARVFHHVTAGEDNRRRRGQLSELAGDVGRHSCRGEPRRHALCHLREAQTAAGQQDRGGGWRQFGGPHRTQSVPSAASVPCASRVPSLPSNMHHGNVPSYPSNMLYRGVRVVPASKSIPWEKEALGRLSSSTAVRLGRERQGGGREDAVHDPEVRGQPSLSHREESEAEQEESVHMTQDYITSLEQGAKPVFLGSGRENVIVLDNDTTFEKVLQSTYPQPPSEWWEGPQVEDRSVVRGGRRWTDLPHPAPTPERLRWVRPRAGSPTPYIPTEEGKTSSLASQASSSQWQQCTILNEWSSKHAMHVQPEDISEAAILTSIRSLSDSAKLRGIAACSHLAQQSLRREGSYRPSWGRQGEGEVPQTLVKGLERLLDDASTIVHVPAAIALHCLGGQSQKAVGVLLTAVSSGGCGLTDKWAGLRCLVEGGVCEDCMVEGLQRHLLNSADVSHRDQAGHLMARLSDRMPLVHALLAEQLTSRGWQERLSACRILPTLLCPLSTDVCGRLVVMSWEDWSSTVRDAAAQALGKTGHGKLLHDELVRRLTAETEVQRLEALRKLHCLQLMTPQLLSAFLPCLSDHHASIRTEAIAICGRLAIRDSAVLQQLVRLLGDSIWHIRAHTLRALNSIGCSDSSVMEQLMWTVRCDKVPAVRAEGCRTLCQLWQRKRREEEEEEEEEGRRKGMSGRQTPKPDANNEGQEQDVAGGSSAESRIISTLRDRLIVEEDATVLRELTSALRLLGGREDKEDPLLGSIRSEVQRLGTEAAITQGVLDGDRAAMTEYVICRPLAHPSTRDYLTSHQRHKFYAEEATPTTELVGKGAWSPDRATIDGHLATIQQRCSSSVTSEQSS